MAFINTDLISNLIIPALLGTSAWSALIALGVGTVVGASSEQASIGASKHRSKQTLLPAIVGCFSGTMLVCMTPIVSTPGLLGGGAYAGVLILFMATFLLPVRAIGGAIVGGTWGVDCLRIANSELS